MVKMEVMVVEVEIVEVKMDQVVEMTEVVKDCRCSRGGETVQRWYR